jgi:phosphoribosylformylglycinamidine cyclo-ligase
MATGALSPEAMATVVEGIAEGCRMSGCALLGGETAEMPGFYPPGRYDLAGFCVAVVEEEQLIDGRQICAGDRILGVASSGIHSNGFSLVRKVLTQAGANAETTFGTNNQPLIEALLTPTQLYGRLVKTLLNTGTPIHGMAHITGGGLPENLPRCLPEGLQACVDPSNWTRPAVYDWLQSNGDIPERDLWHTFNLGIGYCLIVPEEGVSIAKKACESEGIQAWSIGRIERSSGGDGQESVLGLPA